MRRQKLPISPFPIISQWKLEIAIATRVLSDWDKKQYYSFPQPTDAMCEIWQELASWHQRRCCLKMLTTDACLYYKLTCEPLVKVS